MPSPYPTVVGLVGLVLLTVYRYSLVDYYSSCMCDWFFLPYSQR